MRRERKIAVAALLAVAMMFGGCSAGNVTTGDTTPDPTTEPEAIVGETTAPIEEETTAPAEQETTAPVEDETTAPAEDETTAPVEDETTAPVEDETTAPTENGAVGPEPTEPEPTDPEPTEPEPVVSADPWKICGSFTGWGEQDDILLYVGQEENVLVSAEMVLNEGDRLKVRWDDKWNISYPNDNITIMYSGSYRVSFNTETHEVKLIWCGEGEDPTLQEIWTVIGQLNGSSWDRDFRLAESDEENLLISTTVFALNAGEEFKVRHNCQWEETYPNSNYKVTQSGNYRIAFNTETKEVTLISVN